MPKRRVKRKRNKPLVIMLLPALIFIGFIGWLIYALGSHRKIPPKMQRAPPKTQKDEQKDDGVTFIPAILEEPQEITNA